jgi:hypothetical protein
MAFYDSGVRYDSGITYADLSSASSTQQPKTNKNTMKRKPYFPETTLGRPEWFHNFAVELPIANVTLGLPALEVAKKVKEALWLEYVTGPYLTAVRKFGPAGTAGVEEAFYGTSPGPLVLPTFSAPDLGTVEPQPAGTLEILFNYVKTIKARTTYTEAIGLKLGIVGAEDATENPLPTFTLKVEMGDTCQCVRLNFKKYKRQGVAIYSQRGTGPVELIGIDMASPYLDTRPLLAAPAPEVRHYKLRYYEDDAPVGDFTEIQTVTVAPG